MDLENALRVINAYIPNVVQTAALYKKSWCHAKQIHIIFSFCLYGRNQKISVVSKLVTINGDHLMECFLLVWRFGATRSTQLGIDFDKGQCLLLWQKIWVSGIVIMLYSGSMIEISTTLYLCATGEVKLGYVSTQAAVCQVLGGEVARRNWTEGGGGWASSHWEN